MPPSYRERFFSVYYLASAIGASYWTMRRAVIKDWNTYKDYPCISNPEHPRTAKHIKHTYFVSEHAAERIYKTLCKGGRYGR